MALTPELVAFVVNLLALVAGFMKLESRLTKLETTQKLMLDGLIQTQKIERRKE